MRLMAWPDSFVALPQSNLYVYQLEGGGGLVWLWIKEAQLLPGLGLVRWVS